MEGMTVDLHVTADGHIGGGDEGEVLVDVLVLSSFQELTLDDTGVLLSGLIDWNAVVSQVERDDESTVNILGHAGVESSSESQDLLVIVDGLEEVTLGLLGHKFVDVTKSISLISEPVVGRDLDGLGLSSSGVLNLSLIEMSL